jgi:hypothetical protein
VPRIPAININPNEVPEDFQQRFEALGSIMDFNLQGALTGPEFPGILALRREAFPNAAQFIARIDLTRRA